MIQNFNFDMAETFSYFNEESPMNSRGFLLQGLKCTTIETNSSPYGEGISFDVIAGEVYEDTESVVIRNRKYYLQRVRVRCKVADNQPIVSMLSELYGSEVLFHSKKLAGVAETACITNGEFLDITVIALTDKTVGQTLRLENQNMRFVLINRTKSYNTIQNIVVSEVNETSKEATYGDSRVVYNREVNYDISFAMRKERAESPSGSYTNANFVFINLFNQIESGITDEYLLSSYDRNYVTDDNGTFVVKDFKTTRTFFLLAPDVKKMIFRGNATFLDIKVPLI